MLTVAVTGASGHIGGNLVRALLAAGHRVRALYRGDTRALDGLDCERRAIDVREPDTLRGALDGVEVLYHFAALISITGGMRGQVARTNVDGVRHVLAEARAAGVRRVVHCSSIHALAIHADGPITEDVGPADPRRQGAYDRSKAAGERVVLDAVCAGADCVIVNPTGVIGPIDFKPSRMGRVFQMLARRSLPALVPGGFDFVDVRDVVAGAIAAAERGRTGERYILSGGWRSMREIADAAHAVTGARPPRFTAPMALARIGAPFAALWAKLTGAEPLFTSESLAAVRAGRGISHDKAARELGHAPRPLADTVADVYAWFADVGVVDGAPAGRLLGAAGDDGLSESRTPGTPSPP